MHDGLHIALHSGLHAELHAGLHIGLHDGPAGCKRTYIIQNTNKSVPTAAKFNIRPNPNHCANLYTENGSDLYMMKSSVQYELNFMIIDTVSFVVDST